MTRWYQRQWWYVERPFPWLLMAFMTLLAVAAVAGAVAAVVTVWVLL